MNTQIISKQIGEILDEIKRLSNALYAMDTTEIRRYLDNYEVLSTDAALRAEKIACQLRHLIYSSTTVKKPDYLLTAADAHEMVICYQNGLMEITIPSLLPKKKRKQSDEFILDPLYQVLSQYAERNTLPKYRSCVVCFAHIYRRDLPARRIRDYDNIELKHILDIVSTFVMVDDTGLLCDAYNTTELGDKDCTRVFIMEKKRFPGWLEEKKGSMGSISDFVGPT